MTRPKQTTERKSLGYFGEHVASAHPRKPTETTVIPLEWMISYERRRLAILGLVSEVVIRRVEPSDSATLRRVRLRALATDAASFGSTYEREAAFPDQTWTDRAARSSAGDEAATLLAISRDEPKGIVTAICDGAQRQLFHVFEMWVAPEARREGIGRRLLNGIEAWIASCGGTSAHLSVTDAATAAMGLYESAGYKPDGNSAESGHTPGLTEISLLKQL
ncbi:MAG: GNAT family N-acetyltransferase [Dehalococcoidia bacterium]